MTEPMTDERRTEIGRCLRIHGNVSAQMSRELFIEVERLRIVEKPVLEFTTELARLRKIEVGCVSVEELAHSHNSLHDAIDLAEEGIGYTSEYFRDKWGMDEELTRLKGLIE